MDTLKKICKIVVFLEIPTDLIIYYLKIRGQDDM